ncbi:MAG: PAS domain-containing protein, partial [Cyanobacteria bacterium]|nr:PAS domain-containing protein [Cyanobacteriota bacterium]
MQASGAVLVERNARDIFDTSGDYLVNQLEAAQAGIFYGETHNPDYLEQFNRSMKRGDKLNVRLVELAGSNEEIRKIVGEIITLRKGLEANAFEYFRAQSMGSKVGQMLVFNSRLQFLRDFRLMKVQSEKLRQRARDLVKQSTSGHDQYWQLLSTTAIGTAILAILVSVAISIIMSRGIVSRLRTVLDNSNRLAAGQELNPALCGDNEIVDLDRSFHKMAAELTEAHEKERLITERMPAGFILLDDKGTIQRANNKTAGMLDKEATALQNRNLAEFISSSGNKMAFKALENRALGRIIEAELIGTKGNTVMVELSLDKLEASAESQYLAIMLDV